MKERIVLDFGAELKNICNGCAEGVKAKCEQAQKDHLQCALQMSELEEFEVEKYPTSWEELKSMCEELEGQTMDITCDVLKDEIDVTIWNIDRSYAVGEFRFYYDGYNVNLFINTGFSVDISIPKVWSFIKSLIGEE